ncbi:MAG: hypothetical protein JW745_07205 [Sedimentisphaerales bacterium]|nr:hypothetical protein [Sedimentisphaerales bacterium]MBN2844050.1 hypothetical protein [Sedimentisphaerales bacterium]
MGYSIGLKLLSMGFVALTGFNDVVSLSKKEPVEPACKVNKPLVRIYAGLDKNEYIVVGKPGAVTTSSTATVYISNVNAGTRTDAHLADDCSFMANINAAPGDKIRVNAQNQQGKKSYGTFDITGAEVPYQQQVIADKTLAQPAVKTYDIPDKASAASDDSYVVPVGSQAQVQTIYADDIAFSADPSEGTNLSVVLMVINTDSGDVVSTTKISGKSKAYAERSQDNFRIMIDRIIDRCTNIVESEIFRPDFPRTNPSDQSVSNEQNAVLPTTP